MKVCKDALNAHVLAMASMKGKPMVDICWIAIDKLTPNGQVPQGGSLLEEGMGMLKNLGLGKTGTDS